MLVCFVSSSLPSCDARAAGTEAGIARASRASRRGANLPPPFGGALLPLAAGGARADRGLMCSITRRGRPPHPRKDEWMDRRWGLQATMTATYVAVTAGAVLLTELVIFGVAALSPPTPLPPAAAGAGTRPGDRRRAWRRSWRCRVGPDGQLPSSTSGTGGAPVTPGQAGPTATPASCGIPQTTTPVCDLAPASFAVVVSRDRHGARDLLPGLLPGRRARARTRRAERRARCSSRSALAGWRQRAVAAARPVTWCGRPRRSWRAGPRREGQGARRGTGASRAGRGRLRACSTWRSRPRRRDRRVTDPLDPGLVGRRGAGRGGARRARVRAAVHPAADPAPRAARRADPAGGRRRLRAARPGFRARRGVPA